MNAHSKPPKLAPQTRVLNPQICALHPHYKPSDHPPTTHQPPHHPPTTTGGEFLLLFANCEPDSAVDFHLRLALFNQKGSRSDYLPVGQDALPAIYLLAFALFAAAGAAWAAVVARGGASAHKIHYLMAALVLAKALTLLTQVSGGGWVGCWGFRTRAQGAQFGFRMFVLNFQSLRFKLAF